MFYLEYILKKEGLNNAFGQYGSFIHELIEKYLKEELMIFEIENEYIDKFTSNVTAYFPLLKDNKSMAEIYFNQGKEYFSSFNGFNNYEILKIEEKYNFKLKDYNFTGIIDLIVKNEGNYEIIDHKTQSKQHSTRKSKKLKENGFITLVDGRHVPFEIFIQQYLYCVPFKEYFGEYPKYLNLNMVRINDWYKIEFNKDDFEKSIKWCLNLVDSIYLEENYLENIDKFFCDFICSQGINCNCSKKFGLMGG